jgi:hypothetical protein
VCSWTIRAILAGLERFPIDLDEDDVVRPRWAIHQTAAMSRFS